MIFSDHFFILYFFPVFFLIYQIFFKFTKLSIANGIIILFSLIFYASFGVQNIWIFLIPLVFDYIGGLWIYKTKDAQTKQILLVIGILLNILLLGYFKYTHFFLANFGLFIPAKLNTLLTQLQQNLIVPVGISFITFQRISYIVDIYRKKSQPEKNFLRYATYASLFPHLISGPIVRYSDIKAQLGKRVVNTHYIFQGCLYFTVGLGLKLLVADQLYQLVTVITANIKTITSLEALSLVFIFSLRIYTDFAGYSLMAIGIAKFLGFDFPINFDSPYTSVSFQDFWRRWNITLSNWLRDYLYIPLGGNRKGKVRSYINLCITMLIGGLWHGANWNFIIWGGLHGLYLAGERIAKDHNIRIPLPTFVKVLLVFLVVSFTWLTFLFAKPEDILMVLKTIISGHTFYFSTVTKPIFISSIPALIGACIWAFIIKETALAKIKPDWKYSIAIAAVFLYIVGFSLQDKAVPFIYFQF